MNTLRRTAAALAAVAVVGGLGTGVANAGTPGSAGPAEAGLTGDFHSQFFPECDFSPAFDWTFFDFCNEVVFHGRYDRDRDDFLRDHPGYHDFGLHRH